MTSVRFDVTTDFDVSPRAVWDALVDWKGHGDWIPATRVEVDGDDPTAVGTTVNGWTGIGKLALEDRMRVQACNWDDDAQLGRCEVEKLGPVLTGRAGFTLEPHPVPQRALSNLKGPGHLGDRATRGLHSVAVECGQGSGGPRSGDFGGGEPVPGSAWSPSNSAN